MYQGRSKLNIRLFVYIALSIALILVYFFFRRIQNEYLSITTFEGCVEAGYPVLTTYPEQCKIPGKVFTNTLQVSEVDSKEISPSLPEKNMSPKNTSYDIEGQHIVLQNGKWVPPNQASSSKLIINYFGNELRMDIDGDTKEDTVFILTDNTQSSGTLYYLVAALNKDGGYIGTNGILLGDRIAPQTTEFKNNEIVVNYSDRKLGEPMTSKPSVGVSRYFKVENATLIEIQK